jgi:putative redox protein
MTQAVDTKALGQALPREVGGFDTAPTPTEAFAASLAGFVAFQAGRFLTRHGLSREGLTVALTNYMAADRRARVVDIHLTIHMPELIPSLRQPPSRTAVEQ